MNAPAEEGRVASSRVATRRPRLCLAAATRSVFLVQCELNSTGAVESRMTQNTIQR